MRKIAVLISLALILSFMPAHAGQVFQPEVTQAGPPILQANYVSNNVLGIDLKRGLVGYWPFEEKSWNGSVGEVKDISGNSGTPSQNLIPNSNNFTAAGWADIETPIVTPTTLEDDNTGTFEGLMFAQTSIENEDFYTVSAKVPIKGSAPAHYAGIYLWLYIGGTRINAGITIDPYNKTITSMNIGGNVIAPYATSIEEVGTDLRVSVTLQNNGTGNTYARADYYPAVNTNASGTWVLTAQGINTFTDMQLENSSALGPFVATTGSAITNSYNHGKAINGAANIAGGKLGRGGSFEDASNQHVSLVTTWADFTAITISAWIYPVSDATISTIIGSEGGSSVQLRMDATSRLVTLFANGLTDTIQQSVGFPLTLNAWNHVVYVFDGTSSWFFINGVKNNEQAQGGFIRMRSTVHIGRANDAAPTRDMDGRLDEVAVLDRGWIEDEAIFDFNATRGRYIQ